MVYLTCQDIINAYEAHGVDVSPDDAQFDADEINRKATSYAEALSLAHKYAQQLRMELDGMTREAAAFGL